MLRLLCFCIYSHGVMAAVVLLHGCQSAHRLGMHSEAPSCAVLGSGVQVQEGEDSLAVLPTGTLCESASPHTMGTSKAELLGPLPSWSGDRVVFNQQGGVWHAQTRSGVLPVKSRAPIEPVLRWLSGQDGSVSRSRIHVLAGTSPLGVPCVYLGKLGLLGGAPAQPSLGEWLSGPTMILGSNATSKETYHIPEGYRYKGYRLKTGSVVQRALLTINYVAANNEEEYRKLEAAQNAHAAAAGVGVNVGQVVTLSKIEGNVGHSAFVGHEGHDLKHTKHAGLVLYGITEKKKAFFPESKISVQVEILAEKVEEALPPNLHGSHVPAGGNQGDTEPAAQDSSASPSIGSIAVERDKEEDTKPTARPTAPAPTQRSPSPEPAIDLEKAHDLLQRKPADPTSALSESASISLLMHCVQKGEENAKQIKDKEAIMVIGNTGSGKSTFLNYLLGCAMTRKDPEELGLTGLADIVIVSPDSTLQEVTPIGHSQISKTFMPQIVQDTQDPAIAYCDCPGFLDNRGPEINIANFEIS